MAEARQPTLMIDGEGIVRMASSAAAEMFGSTVGDLEGLRLHELLESPGRDVVAALLRSMAEKAHAPFGEPPVRFAARLRLAEGGCIEADLRLSRLSEAATLPGALLIGIEPLARAATAAGPARGVVPEEVRAAATDDAFVICQGDMIEQAEGHFDQMLGVAGTELVGWRIKGLVAAEDLLPVVEILKEVESGAQSAADFGFHLLRAGGRPPLEVAARARRIPWRGGEAVLLGLRDISDSLRTARQAADGLTHLGAALEATGDGVLILGRPESRSPVILASRTLRALFDIDGSRWVGRPFWELWAELRPMHAFPEDDERVLTDVLRDPEAVRVDSILLSRPPGRVVERYIGPMRSTDGAVIGCICTFRDVTQRSRLEAEIRLAAQEARQAREELELLHEELRLANEGLEKRMSELHKVNKDLKVLDEMKSNLLANVSHELQTPLVSIKGFTEMILKGRLGGVTPEQERGLQVALRNINRLIGLIDNLLAFARTEGPSTSLRLEAFPLTPLVEEAVELVREKAAARKVRLKVSMPPGDLVLRADRDKILQVMLNLLTNAIKYNRDGGELSVVAESGRKGTARVEVKDTGIGIPRDELDRVFDRYYQAGNVTGPREGTGIGLSITKDILRQHGCMIRADSEEGKGSVFSFTLPLDRKGKPERASRGPAGASAGAHAGTATGPITSGASAMPAETPAARPDRAREET